MEAVTEITGNPSFGEKTLFPLAERDFLSSENCFLLFRTSFLQIKTATETSLNKQYVLSMKWPFLISKLKNNVRMVELVEFQK